LKTEKNIDSFRDDAGRFKQEYNTQKQKTKELEIKHSTWLV
jgi:hypothetical protein